MEIHHIGYVVKDLNKSLELFKKLGFEIDKELIRDEKRSVDILFLKNGYFLVEIISPINSKSPIINYLNKMGNTPYHFCYETNDLEKTIKELRKNKFIIVESPSDAIAINNQKVAFLYNPHYGLIEILEKNIYKNIV
jgi:methylmalonyl-CoA/ethylmalonyl-CoA epimerase